MTWLELASPLFDLARATTGLAVNWLIQSTLLVSGGLMLGYLLRDRGSAVQSAIYRTTLVAVLACPFATWALSLAGFSGWSLQMPAAYHQESLTADAPINAPPLIEPLVVQPAATSSSFQPTFDSLASVAEPGSTFEPDSSVLPQGEDQILDVPPVPLIAEDADQPAPVETTALSEVPAFSVQGFGIVAAIAGALWLAAGGFLLCRLGLAWWKLNRLRRSAWAAEPRTLDVCRELAALLEVSPPAVLHSPYLPSPCLAGLRHPAVLLPETEMSLPVRDVLVHELAHLRRHDCWWNLLRRMATALLFFQPLLWKLSRRLDSTAEEVCDDYVVQFGGDRRQYAHRLVDIAELSLAPAAAAGVGIVSLRSMLATRVARIMDTSRSLSTRVGHALLALVLLCGLIGTMLAGFVGITPASPPPAIEDIASEEKSETDSGSTSAEVTETAEQPAEQTDEIQTVRGRVVDRAGNPIAGARVMAAQVRWVDDEYIRTERRQVGETRANADGEFEINVPKRAYQEFAKNRLLPFDWKPATLTATAPGYSAAWIGGEWQLGDDDPLVGNIVLRLENETPSIRGRLINLEGQPQAGLTVRVMMLAAAEPGKVDEWLADIEQMRRQGRLPQADNHADYVFYGATMVASTADDTARDLRSAYFPTKWRLLPDDPVFPGLVRTDSEGRFELSGLPPDCMAVLQISGPGVATHSASVVTRAMAKINVPNTGLVGDGAYGYYGVEFDHAVAPGAAVFGTVTDVDSGEPIAGVQVDAHAIVNRMQTSRAEWTSATDAEGRFRIEGLPVGGEKRLDVIPPADQPYLSSESIKLPESNEIGPVEMNVKLRRGIVVRGKVTVAETGEPVDATLHYHPFLNNDYAKQYDRYDPRMSRYEGDDTRYRTKADGSFQTVVIPGRGILAVQTIARGSFCVGLGGEGIEVDRVGRSPVYNHAAPYERVLEIDVPPDADALEYNLTVSRGSSVTYTIRDPQGQPLSGVLASGVAPHGGLPTDESEEPSVEFKALRPGEKRRVALLHRDRRLGRIADIEAPQPAQADSEPRYITLLPCGEVKGRLVNGDGEPVANLALAAYPMRLGMASAQQAVTNANGEFRLEYLPAGARYRAMGNSREHGSVDLFAELDFEPGEIIDLGTIDITSEKRPEPVRTAQGDVVTVRGRVIDPNGRAVPGADVYALRWFWDFGERKPLAQIKADGKGRFEISYRKSQFFDAGRPEQWREAHITAFANGFGPGWVTYGELKPGEEATLRLVTDDVPIEGRIVDLEGHPVVGATIEMDYLNASKKEDLSDWLAAVRAGQSISTAFKHLGEALPTSSAGRWQGITTDSDGRFRMTGIGRERQVKIHVKHPTIVTKTLSVVTRKIEPLLQPAYDSPRSHTEINYGAQFEFAAAPSRPIEGVVRDAESGEPIAGAQIWSSQFAGENVVGVATIKTKTDNQGRYRLEGMPKGEGNEIDVVPTDLPYFTTHFEVPDPPGTEPARLDIELHRGQWITGRVTDKETGRGVSARMYYIATPDNPIAPTLPEIADATHIIRVQDRYRTNPDGSFRVVGLPGRGVVAVGVIQGAYPGGQGYEAISDRDNRDGYRKFNSALSPGEKYPTAMKEVQVPEGDDGTVCDFVLDSGRRVTLQVVDPASRPLGGFEVQGIREVHDTLHLMSDASFDVVAMRDNEARTVLLHHKERGLGKALRVKPADGEDGPVTVGLERVAKVSGRLVDGDGEPVSGVELRIDVSGEGGYGKGLPGTATDAEGRFQHDGFLPGLSYNILAEGAKIEFATVARELKVEAGETIDLGTIDVTSDERPEPKRKAGDRAVDAEGTRTEQIDNAVVEASGRVLTHDGKPAAGAEVLFAPRYGATQADLQVRATTDADGRFTFNFPRSDLARLAEGLRPPWSSPYIVARRNASGPVRKHIVEPSDAKDITLQLVADDIPIEGRIVDLEGQPVADAVLRVLRVEGNPNGTLNDWLQGLRNFGEFWNNNDAWLQESIAQDTSGLPAEVRTDADGRFKLRGMGRERVVDLRLEAPRLESTELWVTSRRDGALSVPFEKAQPRLGTYVLYNSTFTHSAAPSQPVEGVVRDADSGEPIAGVTLYCEKRAGRDIHGRYAPETKTDEQGRYLLNGLPKGADNEIAVVPPAGTPYVPQNVRMDTSRGLDTKKLDIDLKAASLIRGRITDEATGKPVASARVEYFTAIVNRSLDVYPGFRDADDITTTTDADGRYEIVGLPGRGFLAIRAASDEFAAGQKIDVIEADYDENPGQLRDTLFRTHPSTCIAEQHHAVAAVEIPTGTTEFGRDVVLGRGATRQARILDPDGNPLAGVEVNRRGVYACEWYGGEVTLDDAEFTVFGLVPDKPRSLFLKHKGRGLVGAFAVEADSAEPLEMRLQPAGSLVGRVVDEDGKPVPHTTLYGKLADGQGELDGFFFRASTDEAGRFRADDLIPGLKYQLRHHHSEREYVILKPNTASGPDLTVTGGDVAELGDLQAFDPSRNASTSSAQNETKKPTIKKSGTSTSADAADSAADKNRMFGQVVDAAGTPVAGAKFYWFRSRVHDIDPIKPRLIATSDESGNFQFAPPPVGSKEDEAARWEYSQHIVVRAPGHGFVYTSPGAIENEMSGSTSLLGRVARAIGGPKGATIKLPAAGDAIRGRIVDMDGRAVAGASVAIRWFNGEESAPFWRHEVKAGSGADAELRARMKHLLAVIEPVQLQDLLPVATTDADGRFELRDIGQNRYVQLLIRGEAIESTEVVVRNDSNEKVAIPPDRHSDSVQQIVYGREFLHAVGPSKAIEGRVLDVDTEEPIANAVVRAFRVHGHRLHSSREREQFAARTDAAGRYRISGLPIGPENELVAFGTGEVPYVPIGQLADTSATGGVINQDFRLKRGVWAEGRVFDAKTDKPFTGEITYYYFRNVELEKQMPGIRRAYVDGLYWTNSNGEFRVPVLPTRGILAYRYEGNPIAMDRDGIDQYPNGFGEDDIAGSENIGSVKNFPTEPHNLMPSNYQRVAEVNPKTGDATIRVDMSLVASRSINVRIVERRALISLSSEVEVYGIMRLGWKRINTREFEIEGLEQGETRKVLVFDRRRNLVGGATASLDDTGPIEIELQPGGSIQGRLVDEDGEPITDATVVPNYDKLWSLPGAAIWPPHPDLTANPTRIPVDSEGRFQLDGLIPGWMYSAWASAPRKMGAEMMERGIGRMFDDVTVEAGQTLDLGDVQPMSENGPRPKQVETPAKSTAPSTAREKVSSKGLKINGQVTGPDGKPAAGAHIAVIAASLRQQRGGDLGRRDEVLAEASTNADGRYEITLKGVSRKTHRYAALIAKADGSALAWHRLNLDEPEADISLQLVAEEPIRGRLVDIEGQPAGGVRMSYRAVMLTMEDRRAQDGVGFREFNSPPAAWPRPVTTDDDGRFVLPGIAAGQGVWLTVEANDRFAPQDISLNTGLPEQRGASDGTYRSQVVRNLKPGEEPVLALAPAQIFEGIVTYEDTGEPAPHARLTVWASQQKLGSMYSVPGKADAQGRYRIHPYPGIRFGITAYPPDGAPYLTRQMPPVDWEDVATVKKMDVTLPRGVLARGKILEAGSGRPVAAATIQYDPEEANPNDADDILTGWQGIQVSNEKGEFEIVALPGPGNLLVHGPEGEFILEESSSSQLSRGTPGGQRRYAHAFQRIEPQAVNDVLDLNIELQPAKKIAGRIVDESGAPVDEALMVTRLHITPSSPYWRGFAVELRGGRFELGGLAPGEEYPTHFLDAKRRLGATVNLKAGDAEPTVMLKPCGEATARFVDPDGEPLDGFSPMLEMIVASGVHQHDLDAIRRGELAADSDYVSNIDRTNHWSRPPTDDEGRITFPALIPGATYRIGRFNDGNWSIAKDFSVSSGESLDLGDIVMRLEN